MNDFHQHVAARAIALLMTGTLVAACSSTPQGAIDYRSDAKAKQSTLAEPPNLLDETADQRSLPPQGGETTLSAFEHVQHAAPAVDNTVMPVVPGMHIQRDGSESWLVIDGRSPADVWPQVRRFWQEQGFLLVQDDRNRGVMETDWNETHPKISDGLIRDTLTWATGNSYVTSGRNKYRTRLEAAPGGGTYVFISQKGLRQELSGTDNETTSWVPRPNDPTLELDYLKRLMTTLGRAKQGVPDVQLADEASAAENAKKTRHRSASAAEAESLAAQNVTFAAQQQPGITEQPAAQSELTLNEPPDRAWQSVARALDRANFTVASSDPGNGVYTIEYVDPKDLRSDEQGFWSQLFHGHEEKAAKSYQLHLRAASDGQTDVAILTDSGEVDTSRPAQQIMALLQMQLR
jgi:outer membrane protein assembly factor BamC